MNIEAENKEWFTDIFEKHFDYIRNYLYYLSGNIMLTEDLAQDVFLQLWEKRTEVKSETVQSFLFTIARNAFLKSYRRNKIELKFKSGYFGQIENESPEFIMEVKEFDAQFQNAISGLPEKCRVIYLMNRMDEMTYTQIAENLDVSVKAVEKQMSKALKILRNILGERV